MAQSRTTIAQRPPQRKSILRRARSASNLRRHMHGDNAEAGSCPAVRPEDHLVWEDNQIGEGGFGTG